MVSRIGGIETREWQRQFLFIPMCLLFVGTLLLLIPGSLWGMSYRLFSNLDAPSIQLVAALYLFWRIRKSDLPAWFDLSFDHEPIWHTRFSIYVFSITLGFGVLGTYLVYLNFPLSMDEYMTVFQAKILQQGHISAAVPEKFANSLQSLQPIFTQRLEGIGVWASFYRPGMAFFYAFFGSFSSPLFTAGSAVVLLAVIQQVWPSDHEAKWIGMILFLGSSQVWLNSFTTYAMPAHVFFNSLWLYLFLRDDRLGHSLAPWIGVMACSLHQIHVHPLFAAPYILGLIRPFRPKLILYYGSVYLAGLVVLWFWPAIIAYTNNADVSEMTGTNSSYLAAILMLMERFRWTSLASVTLNVERFIVWQHLLLWPLVFWACRRTFRDRHVQNMLIATGLTLTLHVVFMPDQGHGWGYRYLHALIPLYILAGIVGWKAIPPTAYQASRRLLGAATLVSVLIFLPWRAISAHNMVAPYVEAMDHLQALDTDIVLLETTGNFYAQDLVRNDPYLRNRPLIYAFVHTPSSKAAELCQENHVTFIGEDTLTPIGIRTHGRSKATKARNAKHLREWKAACRNVDFGSAELETG